LEIAANLGIDAGSLAESALCFDAANFTFFNESLTPPPQQFLCFIKPNRELFEGVSEKII
jgi:hypothetical protein